MKLLALIVITGVSAWAQLPEPGGGSGGGGGGLSFSGTCTSFPSGAIGICMQEGTAPTGIADTALVYPSSDATSLKAKLNNGSEVTVCTTTGESGCGGGVTLTSGVGSFCLPDPNTCWPYAAVASSTFTSKVPKYVQFTLLTTVPLGKIAAYVAFAAGSTCGGGSAACGFAFAVMDDTCTKIAGTDAVTASLLANDTSYIWSFTTPGTVLSPGEYYAAMATDSTALRIYGPNTNTVGGTLASKDTVPRWFTGSNSATGDGATLVIPSACGTKSALTTAEVPMLRIFP